MKKSDQNVFLRLIKNWQFMLLVLSSLFLPMLFALQQLTNTGFDWNING